MSVILFVAVVIVIVVLVRGGPNASFAKKEAVWSDENYTQEWHVDGLVLHMPESWHLSKDGDGANIDKKKICNVWVEKKTIDDDPVSLCSGLVENYRNDRSFKAIEVLESPRSVYVKTDGEIPAARCSLYFLTKQLGRGRGYLVYELIRVNDGMAVVQMMSAYDKWSDAKPQFEYILDNITLEDA